MGKWVETGELGAGAGAWTVAGVVAGFFDWDCEAGVDLVCAATPLTPQYAALVAIAKIKIANRFETSGTVRKTFLRGCDAWFR